MAPRSASRVPMASTARSPCTTDLDAAVDGASAVLLQIRVGGQAARLTDETIPLRCGCVGQETTGAGGFAKALRTVPVVLDIADRVRRLGADDAWIVDFTNPVGIVTRALLDHGHRAVGLCNVAIGFQRLFAEWLGVTPESVQLGHAGLNHLTWIRSVRVDGEEVLPALLRDHGDEIAAHVELPRRIIDNLGAVPSYYLRYYYQHDLVVQELLESRSRAEEVMDVERELLELYRDPQLHDKPDLLMQRGGAYYSEAAINLLCGLFGDNTDVQVVDVRNNGIIPELPADAVIEVPARVGAAGAEPLPVPALAPAPGGPDRAHRRIRGADRRGGGERRSRGRVSRAADASAHRTERTCRAVAARPARRQPQVPAGVRMTADELIVAVDGGNSKTDVLLLGTDGTVLASVRGAGSSPHQLGLGPAIRVVDDLVDRAWLAAGLRGRATAAGRRSRRCSWPAPICPSEEVALADAVAAQGWARAEPRRQRRVRGALGGDRHRARRRGHRRCRRQLRRQQRHRGAGPGSRRSATSPVTGAADPTSAWRRSVPGCAARMGAARRRCLPERSLRTSAARPRSRLRSRSTRAASTPLELIELPPLVVNAAEAGDAEALAIMRRQGSEVTRLAIAALHQLEMEDSPVQIVLGGSVLASSRSILLDFIAASIRAEAPKAADQPVHHPARGRRGARGALAGRARAAPPRSRLRAWLDEGSVGAVA